MGLEYALRRGRELGQLVGRPNRPPDQFAAAIRTAPARQTVVPAIDAERALERTHQRVRRIRRQVFVATLAVRLEDQHQAIP